MQVVDVQSEDMVRPDRITSTGVIAPYGVRQYPGDSARGVLRRFERVARSVGPALAGVAISATGAQPEEIAMRAGRIADYLAQGFQVPRGTDPRVLRAAQLILKGEPFIIRSAGRTVTVG